MAEIEALAAGPFMPYPSIGAHSVDYACAREKAAGRRVADAFCQKVSAMPGRQNSPAARPKQLTPWVRKLIAKAGPLRGDSGRDLHAQVRARPRLSSVCHRGCKRAAAAGAARHGRPVALSDVVFHGNGRYFRRAAWDHSAISEAPARREAIHGGCGRSGNGAEGHGRLARRGARAERTAVNLESAR